VGERLEKLRLEGLELAEVRHAEDYIYEYIAIFESQRPRNGSLDRGMRPVTALCLYRAGRSGLRSVDMVTSSVPDPANLAEVDRTLLP
jgi:hypothetical protein